MSMENLPAKAPPPAPAASPAQSRAGGHVLAAAGLNSAGFVCVPFILTPYVGLIHSPERFSCSALGTRTQCSCGHVPRA